MEHLSPVKRCPQRILRLGFAMLAVIGSHEGAAAPPVPPVDANVNGVWGSLGNWPLIAIHSILTRDGRVLTYGTDEAGRQTGRFIYDVWDPKLANGDVSAGHATLPNFTATDIFCSSHVLLPGSNSVLIAGGDLYQNGHTLNQGNSDANLFSGEDDNLTPDGSMKRARWYSTTITLVNGESYIQGGRGSGSSNTAGAYINPEVRGLDGNFRLLSNIKTSALSFYYPRNYVAPDGRVFGYDVRGYTYFLSPGLGSITLTGRLPATGGNRSKSATSVMYAPGKILNFGGTSNSSSSNIIDINGVTPTVTPSGTLAKPRQWVTGTVLPNGEVLATGGSKADSALLPFGASVTGVENRAEIWNPATRKWKVKASGAVPRLYHSTALLLSDGTVLVAGGGAGGPIDNLNAQIYYPPYLFGAGGVYASRPVITSAPEAIPPGKVFKVGVSAGSIVRVTVVKTGADTHSFNMDQRFVQFPFTRAGNTLTVTANPNPAVLTPGAYMLFVLNSQGVPSKSKIISVKIVP